MRLLCYAFLVVLLAASCRDKVICPTFQSTYILDDSVRNTYFSYLWYLSEDERKSYLAANAKPSEVLPPDSLGAMVASTDKAAGVDYFAYTAEYKPPVRETKKTKYGIIKRTPVIPDLVRNIQLKTGPRQNVLTPPAPETEDEQPAGMPQDSAAYAPLDSTAAVAQTDSLGAKPPVAAKVEKKKAPWEPFKYGFNPLDSMQPDQEYYFRKYGWLLQNAKPKEEPTDSTASDSTSAPQKGIKGLFKKKNKEESEGGDVSEGEDDWYQEEGQGSQPEQDQPKQKPPKEKKPKEKKPKATKQEESTEPEDEGGGF